MKSFGLTVVYATCFSLLASFTLTPMLCAAMLKPKSGVKPAHRHLARIHDIKHTFLSWINDHMEFLKKEYKHVFDLIFRAPKTTIIV